MYNKSKVENARIVLLFLFGFTALFWTVSSNMFPKWPGVPPVPSKFGAKAVTLGDEEFSYRFFSLLLQNFGEMGAQTTPLKDYNFDKLSDWFFLLHDLDHISNHVPMLAAHYFGATVVPEQAEEIVKYLRVAGDQTYGEKWRWLAHAAYLAQHKMGDMDLALNIAYKLQRMNRDYPELNMPQWARQMPVFVLKHRGEKQASRKLMENMLITDRVMDPAELNFMKLYLMEEFGVSEEYVERLVRMRRQE